MTVAQLAHPEWFEEVIWTLIAVGTCLALAAWRSRRRRVLLIGSGLAQTPHKWSSDSVLWIALVAIAIALLGPRIGERLIEASASGVDVVLVIDVSRSMDAQDTPPNRLDRARRGVEELLSRLEPTDRVALAVFASRGVLLTPLTPDRYSLIEWISTLDTQLIRPASSNLASGIRAAVEAFETGSERPRVIVVASDGEDPNQDAELGVGDALAAQSRVIAIGLGTELGSAIPASGSTLRDRVGRVVVTRRHGERLTHLAEATSGSVFLADQWGSFDFDAAASEIRRDAGSIPGQRTVRRVQAIRVAPFAALALVLLLIEGLPRARLPDRRRSRFRLLRRLLGRFRRRASTLAGLAILATLLGAGPAGFESPKVATDAALDAASAAHHSADDAAIPPPEAVEQWVRREPRNALALISLGHARFAHGNPVGAANAFSAAAVYATDARTAAHSHYGLGVARLEKGDLEAARDAFFDSLAFDPANDETRFNLEWTLAALVETPPDEPPPDAGPHDEPETSNSERDDADAAREQPASESQSESEPQPGSRPDSDPTSGDPLPSQLSERQQLRSLARVTDDLERSIRAATHAIEGRDDLRESDSW